MKKNKKITFIFCKDMTDPNAISVPVAKLFLTETPIFYVKLKEFYNLDPLSKSIIKKILNQTTENTEPLKFLQTCIDGYMSNLSIKIENE